MTPAATPAGGDGAGRSASAVDPVGEAEHQWLTGLLQGIGRTAPRRPKGAIADWKRKARLRAKKHGRAVYGEKGWEITPAGRAHLSARTAGGAP